MFWANSVIYSQDSLGPKESVNDFGLFLEFQPPLCPFISFSHLSWPDCSAGVPQVELISKVPEQICCNL